MLGTILAWYTRVSLPIHTHNHLVFRALVFTQMHPCPPFSPSSFVTATCELSTAKTVLERAVVTISSFFFFDIRRLSNVVWPTSRKLWGKLSASSRSSINVDVQHSNLPCPLSNITLLQLVRRGGGPIVPPIIHHTTPIPFPHHNGALRRPHSSRLYPFRSRNLHAHTLAPSPILFRAAPAYPAHKAPRYLAKEPTQAAYVYASPSTSQNE